MVLKKEFAPTISCVTAKLLLSFNPFLLIKGKNQFKIRNLKKSFKSNVYSLSLSLLNHHSEKLIVQHS